MSDTRTIEITRDQAQFILQCIDTHQKQFGLKVSGNCFAMSQFIDQQFKEDEEKNVHEIIKQEAI